MSNTINTLPLLASDNGFYTYLLKINKIPSLTAEEEYMLAKSYLEQNDIEAVHLLVKSHLKLVAKIALSYRGYGLPVVDLVSEGNLGLLQAVKRYNPNLGFRLSTYAIWWIKAAIQDYILRSWSLVKLGTTAAQKKLFFNLGKIKDKITKLHARAVNSSDYKQISDESGVSIADVSEVNKRLSNADLSLNTPVGYHEDDTTELIELVQEHRPNQEVILANWQDFNSKKEVLKNALQTLTPRELYIIRARKLQEKPDTLEKLSLHFNISKERIRQIENKAFEKLQLYVMNVKQR
ncbi:alternative sigma factor RpoH [Orientia chuto str. Dubai]|uniref:RNA polymerase sigma factor RpoH n=1 Tax=Orientia chuto str. Dubai TaxID=1359168 RepID=A0A0F3MJZ4_9RICK|nr:RNA polymerase sigma factor RpoH [Candidatus Orientia mediorientalis]KJV55787.1 alternative sigma factor RpoH [Orientia chuto str. Dubai]